MENLPSSIISLKIFFVPLRKITAKLKEKAISSPFLTGFFVLSGFFALIIIFLKGNSGSAIVNPYIWYIYGYIVLLTLGTYYLVERGIKRNPYTAHNYIMGFSAIRLFVSFIGIFLYFYCIRQYGVSFLINFFILYFSYTTFEIRCLFSNLRTISKNGEN